MSYDAKETGAQTGNPVELLKFGLLGQTWCYTSADVEVVHDGLTYVPIPLKRTAPEQAPKGGDSALTLTVPETHDVAVQYRGFVPFGRMSLVISRKHRDDAEAITFWVGVVRCVTFNPPMADIHCEPISAGMKRDGLRYQYQATCNHMLYSEPCGLSSVAYKTTVVVEAFDGDSIQASGFATHDDGWFKSGFLFRGNDRRMMTAHSGDTVTVLLPFEGLAVGDSLDAYAGCPHDRVACLEKFDNLDNFGGFPFIPTKNPFQKGLT